MEVSYNFRAEFTFEQLSISVRVLHEFVAEDDLSEQQVQQLLEDSRDQSPKKRKELRHS